MQQHHQTSRKHLSFTSAKPPFGGGGGDYHQFASGPDQEFEETVVVKKRPVSLTSSEFLLLHLDSQLGFVEYFVFTFSGVVKKMRLKIW